VKARQSAFRTLHANTSLRANVIQTGPQGCYRCTRRAVGTTTATTGIVEAACIEHATKFDEVFA
jgi:hypothetical protein